VRSTGGTIVNTISTTNVSNIAEPATSASVAILDRQIEGDLLEEELLEDELLVEEISIDGMCGVY
jgi:mycofactocin precursor